MNKDFNSFVACKSIFDLVTSAKVINYDEANGNFSMSKPQSYFLNGNSCSQAIQVQSDKILI
jgi:hypothetical protein